VEIAMPAAPNRASHLVALVLVAMLCAPGSVRGQLPSPAADTAEEFLEVVRTGDRARIRAFVEARFTTESVRAYPLDEYHVPVLASVGRQIQGLETANTELSGPHLVSMLLTGGGRPALRP
jgi:hypothetical protein